MESCPFALLCKITLPDLSSGTISTCQTLPSLCFHSSFPSALNRRMPPSPLNPTTTLGVAFGPRVPAAALSMPLNPPPYDHNVFPAASNNSTLVFQAPRHKKDPTPNSTPTTAEEHLLKEM